jgi:flagellar FliL protein
MVAKNSASIEPPQTPPLPAIVPRKSSLPKLALIAGLVMLAGIIAAWFAFGRGDTPEASTAGSSNSSELTTVHLDGFIVNLADREENHFLRVTMDLALDHLPPGTEKDKPASGLPTARIRDAILSVLTDCSADALLTPDGKNQLKKKLIETLNRSVPELGVRDIYFTEFLVQR